MRTLKVGELFIAKVFQGFYVILQVSKVLDKHPYEEFSEYFIGKPPTHMCKALYHMSVRGDKIFPMDGMMWALGPMKMEEIYCNIEGGKFCLFNSVSVSEICLTTEEQEKILSTVHV